MVQLGCVECFELRRREHVQFRVPSAGVVEVLNVVSDSHAELFRGAPRAGVEQFGLHTSPERLDECIDAPIVVKQQYFGRWVAL